VSQVVVCKIRPLAFLVSQALLLAISFQLFRVVLAILLPVARVRLAPLPRTFQTDLPINRIRSDFSPMIIALALSLACRLAANCLLGTVYRRLKDFLAVTTTELFHQPAPPENGKIFWKRLSPQLNRNLWLVVATGKKGRYYAE
jgi:hypothetical protein